MKNFSSFKFQVSSFKKLFFFATFAFLFFLFPFASNASTLYFLPQAQTVYIGDAFIVEVGVDAENKEINTVDGAVLFSKDKLQVIDINKGGSVINLWIKEPVYSNEKGEIDFSGGMPNGFKGQGAILKITFKVIGSISDQDYARINFKENFDILLNDGKGTIDEIFPLDGNYKIIEKETGLPVISSPSWPDQEKWYRGNEVQLYWDLVKNAEYSYILTKDALIEPDNIPDRPEGDLQWMGAMTLKGFIDDGIYYFHLKQKLPGKDWSNKVSFRMMVDNFSPEEFIPKIAEIEGKKYLVFAAQDKTSGIDHYDILETEHSYQSFFEEKLHVSLPGLLQKKKEWVKANSPYLLKDQNLASDIKIKAVDKAGNERLAEIIPPKKVIPYKKIGLAILSIVVIVLFMAWIKYIKCKNKKICG